MPVSVSKRVFDVVRRGLETARLDPAAYAVRIRLIGSRTQTEFADAPDPADHVFEDSGVRIFLDATVTAHPNATIDVSAEHEQIVVTTG